MLLRSRVEFLGKRVEEVFAEIAIANQADDGAQATVAMSLPQ
jgi:hypothetical protein